MTTVIPRIGDRVTEVSLHGATDVVSLAPVRDSW